MNKSAEYIQFEAGFLKSAEEAGCDVTFLRGYIKEADEIVELWKNAFDELAEKSGDPLYRYKLANEILYANMLKKDLEKRADFGSTMSSIPEHFKSFLGGMNNSGLGGAQNKLQDFFTNHAGNGQGMGGGIMKWLADSLHNNPNLLSSLVAGGGGGGLLGLLLGAVMGHPLAGLMLGGLGGAGMSAFAGNQSIQNSAKSLVTGQPKEVPQPGSLAERVPGVMQAAKPIVSTPYTPPVQSTTTK
jgi:hypothetical protein